ncbi:hypothetical protein ARAM_002987 [Aspergillus rambellii]|uniref:Stealth protein CR2 conserved region 2 domain-containing protein n=1 Tax=Aspergillus rambellii TaxID=308745 RepID=A0A0F8VTN2_9EURO|nr:hypothetical protein ARAM_002987 [Aspergillus rambellii]
MARIIHRVTYILATIFTIFIFRSVIQALDYQPEGVSIHHPYHLEPEWEWARNVSIVYTWVNGSDPNFRSQRKRYGGIIGGSLDRDNNELLYSLRSLNEFLPWHTGMVYIVTPNQAPYWLNQSHPRVQIINQNDLIPPEVHPTFNTNTIEQFLHYIPGLSELFIHFNDDYFLHASCHPSDFFTGTKGVKIFLTDTEVTKNRSKLLTQMNLDRNPWDKSLLRTFILLLDTYRLHNMPLSNTHHAPYVYSKQVFHEMHSVWFDELHEGSWNRFRSGNDILIPVSRPNVGQNMLEAYKVQIAHYGFTIQQGWSCCKLANEIVTGSDGTIKYVEFTSNTTENAIKIATLRQNRNLKMFNINDDMDIGDSASDARVQLNDFLDQEYGHLIGTFEVRT